MSTDPTAIKLDLEANTLDIAWSDGHTSNYTGGRLRFVCPCAQCRGHYPGQVPEPQWDAVKDVRVTHAEGVGNYAIRLDFSDGHSSGIFSFQHLRKSDGSED